MSKIVFVFLAILAISAIAIYGLGQTDQSITQISKTPEKEILNGIPGISQGEITVGSSTGPLKLSKYKNDGRTVEIWIENPAPYFTYIPASIDGKPNIVIKGAEVEDISFELKKTGLFETVSRIEDFYKIYEKVDKIKLYVEIVFFPPKSLTEASTRVLELAAPLISADDTSLAGNFIALTKETVDIDERAYYMFIQWFLSAKNPIDIVGLYKNTPSGKIRLRGKHTLAFLAQNTLWASSGRKSPDIDDDMYWPRGWPSYVSQYLPKNVEGFVLAPNMALVMKLKMPIISTTTTGTTTTTASTSTTSTMPASFKEKESELELEIKRYQSLKTIEADPNRPSSETLSSEVRVYLPPRGGSAWGDERDIVETLSCIYNGNYEKSQFKPDENSKEYKGTLFERYSFSTARSSKSPTNAQETKTSTTTSTSTGTASTTSCVFG